MARQWRLTLLAAALVGLLLPLCGAWAAEGVAAEAGDILFTIPPGWQRSDQGNVVILTPPGIPAGKTGALRILTGEELTTSLRAWFDARWTAELDGATVVEGGEVEAKRVGAGYDAVISHGEFRDRAGKPLYVFLLAAQSQTRVASYCFRTESLAVLQQCAETLVAFAGTLTFKNLQPGAVAPAPALVTPAAPAAAPAEVTPASPTTRQEPAWRSFMQLRPRSLRTEFDELTSGLPLLLMPPSQTPVTLQQAIANARARLHRDASDAAIAALRASPSARSVGGLHAAAMAGIVANKPAAALAALLIAYEKEPKNPALLVNLAGLLAHLGMPMEALALLDAADKLGTPPSAPGGLKGQAIALSNRGYALMLLSRWKEAEAPLRKAVALEPQLSEAARNLAYVLAQDEEKEEEARKFFLAAAWRFPCRLVCGGATSDADPDPLAPGVESVPALDELFDLSKASPPALPIVLHPTDMAHWKAFDELRKKREAQIEARWRQRDERGKQIRAVLSQRPDSLSERRAIAIQQCVGMVGWQPDVRELERQQEQAHKEVKRKSEEIWTRAKAEIAAYNKTVDYEVTPLETALKHIDGIINAGFAELTPAWNRYDEARRKYVARRLVYVCAIAAQLGDPLRHELVMGYALNEAERGYWLTLLQHVFHPYHTLAMHGFGKEPKPVDDPAEFSERDSPCCGSGGAGKTYSMDLEVLDLSVNCESIGVEVSTPGWLGFFASADLNINGQVTVFAGAKAEGSLPGVMGGPKLEFKDGLYLTVDKNGVQDVGGRVQLEASMTVMGVETSTTVDSMDFSFVPGR